MLMASPPIPPLFEHLARRPFAFYPPIQNLQHNEWLFKKATWSELVAVNRQSGGEVSIPRRFVAEISTTDDPFLIVGLTRELEYRDGALWPYQRLVIEMPVAVGETPAPASVARRASPAPVIAIRLESRHAAWSKKVVGGALLLALGVCVHVTALNLIHIGEMRGRQPLAGDRSYLELSGADDYFRIVQRLGRPASDRWTTGSAAIHYRALSYPGRHFTVILVGSDRASAAYIGTLDSSWRVIHTVPLATGGTTFALLRNLQPF